MTNTPPCLICQKPVDQKTRPFCSDRCRLVDLNRWLNGSYAIPVLDGAGVDGIPDEDEA